MGLSLSHLLLLVLVVLILFGAGKLPKVMGDLGKGVRNFRDGLKQDEETPPAAPPKRIEDARVKGFEDPARDQSNRVL
jgi:sec-independent protein translocase protein TatA